MQRRLKDDIGTTQSKEQIEYCKKFANWCNIREEATDTDISQKIKWSNVTTEEMHNQIVKRIHSRINSLKDAVPKFEKTFVNDKRLRAKLSNTLLSDFTNNDNKNGKNIEEEEIEREQYLIKFSYKILKFSYTLSHATNGAVRCVKISSSSHEYEKLKAKVSRRIMPGIFASSNYESDDDNNSNNNDHYGSILFLSFYWIHNDLLAQNFQTKIAKSSSPPRVMDMFTVTHRRMLKSTIINGFGGTLPGDDVALLFDDFWTIDRQAKSTYYEMVANEELPTFPATFSYFSTLTSEFSRDSKTLKNRNLRFMLMCKVLTKEREYEMMKKDEWVINDPSLVLPEYLIAYELVPKDQLHQSIKSPTNLPEKLESLEQDKILESQKETKNNVLSEIASMEDELKREQMNTRKLLEKYKQSVL